VRVFGDFLKKCVVLLVNFATKRALFLLGVVLCTVVFGSAFAQEVRLPVTVANNTGAPLTNYTVRVDITAANAPGFDFNNNGDGIQVVDGGETTRLGFYVESVDPISQTAVVWVQVPNVPVSPPDTQFFLDYGLALPAPLSDASATFTEPGFKYHSQFYNQAGPGPETRAEGLAQFDFDTVAAPGSTTGCNILSGVGTTNNQQFGSNRDFALFIEARFIVTTPALYEFRFGGDFGHGGELYLDGVTLEEGWTDDLWWQLNYNNVDVLQGSRFLGAGAHEIRALGFERCCDGQVGFQFRIDTDGDGSLADEVFADLNANSTGINLLASSCPTATATIGAVTTVPVTLAKFSSFKAGPFIKFRWQTADESFNAGFDLWTLEIDENGEQELAPLNRRLIPSKGVDSRYTKYYGFRFFDRQGIDNVVISSVDLNGDNEFFGPFEIGETYGDDLESQPTDWAKVYASFKTSMLAKGYHRVNNRWRKISSLGQDNDTSKVQLAVERDGVYRLSHEDLLAAGLDLSGVEKSLIALSQDGRGIPRRIGQLNQARGARSKLFGPGSYIDFVGQIAKGEESIYRTEGLYQLSVDPALVRAVSLNRNISRNPQSWSLEEIRLNDRNIHSLTSILETPWLMNRLFRTGTQLKQEYQLEVPTEHQLRDDQMQQLIVDLVGLADSAAQDLDDDGLTDPDHLLEISLNGEVLSTISFEGIVARTEVLDLPQGLLKNGQNTVSLILRENGYRFDVIGVDAVTLRYAVDVDMSQGVDFQTSDTRAESDGIQSDGLEFDAPTRRGLLAYQYQDNGNLMRLKISRNWRTRWENNNNEKRFSVPFSAQGDAKLLLAQSLPRPSRIELLGEAQTIDLRDTDLLVISHPAFTGDVLDRYVAARKQHGIDALVVSTEDIAENYGLDVALPVAIKRFLIDADSKVDYQSVLLVGGHSFDYNNYLSDDSMSFIPSFYRPVYRVPHTPSDQAFVDFDNDGYPEKAIGRWPARTIEEVARIANKSMLWAGSEAARTRDGHQVLLMSDYERETPFIEGVEGYFNSLNTEQLSIGGSERLYLDELKLDPSIDQSNFNAQVQSRAESAIANGATWLLYGGHGSPFSWSPANFIINRTIKDLGNLNSPVLVTSLACYTTYFENPSHDSLAHQLLFADGVENNGAVIVQGPTMVGGYQNQLKLANLIAARSVRGSSVGDSVYKGMRALPINYSNAIRNWALLADPTLPVQ